MKTVLEFALEFCNCRWNSSLPCKFHAILELSQSVRLSRSQSWLIYLSCCVAGLNLNNKPLSKVKYHSETRLDKTVRPHSRNQTPRPLTHKRKNELLYSMSIFSGRKGYNLLESQYSNTLKRLTCKQ